MSSDEINVTEPPHSPEASSPNAPVEENVEANPSPSSESNADASPEPAQSEPASATNAEESSTSDAPEAGTSTAEASTSSLTESAEPVDISLPIPIGTLHQPAVLSLYSNIINDITDIRKPRERLLLGIFRHVPGGFLESVLDSVIRNAHTFVAAFYLEPAATEAGASSIVMRSFTFELLTSPERSSFVKVAGPFASLRGEAYRLESAAALQDVSIAAIQRSAVNLRQMHFTEFSVTSANSNDFASQLTQALSICFAQPSVGGDPDYVRELNQWLEQFSTTNAAEGLAPATSL